MLDYLWCWFVVWVVDVDGLLVWLVYVEVVCCVDVLGL